MIRMILLLSMLMVLTACSEFALLVSGSSLALSQNSYTRVYNTTDVLTLMSTEKSIKRHVYEKGKRYIYVTDTKKQTEVKQCWTCESEGEINWSQAQVDDFIYNTYFRKQLH